jgi:hypothetical protein
MQGNKYYKKHIILESNQECATELLKENKTNG